MGRRRLSAEEVERVIEMIEPKPQEESLHRSGPALTRVVAEHPVSGSVRLVTVDVDVRGNGFDGLDVRDAMVRLRPIGVCSTEDVDWAEDKARKLGAMTVTRMPLMNCVPITAEEGPDELLSAEEPAVEGTMGDVMVDHLQRLMSNEGCSEQEKKETIDLARQMLGEAGG